MSKVKDKNCSEDPCLWLCFPCLFTWMICEKGLQCCCMCICCITPNSQETINIEEVKNETKEDIN